MRNQTINLNLIPTGVMPVVHLSQYDQDADGSLIFNIYNGPVPYDLTGCVAHIQGSKPDGTVFDYQCTVYQNYVTSATQYQMTTSAGTYEAELRITNGNNTIGTINFQFAIEASTTAHVDLSDTDIPALMNEINQDVYTTGQNADRAETAADEAEDYSEDSEAWAVGQRDGVDVPSTDPTYENNSKYYASQAGAHVENAEAWAVGERGGVPVTSGDDTYENNSKYYAGQADDSAEDSEAYAIGKRNGVDVTSGDVAYENNSKYYSGQSEGSAEDSEAYANGTRAGVPVTSGDPAYENNSKYWNTQASGQIENSEAWAIGERGGVPVTSGDPTYENNSKYYSAQSASKVEDAEAWAVGQRDGTDVPSTDPTYHNNAKYYSGQIGNKVEDAEAWAKGTRSGVPVTSGDPAYENNSDYYSEQSEAWADGQINGVDVPNTHPAYHNNAKYWSQQSAGQTISGLSDVSISSLQNDDILQYNSTSTKWENTTPSDLVPTMTGATSGTAGTKGVVPAPSAGDEGKVLFGSGTWGTVTTSDMTGATAGAAGAHGLVPAPSAGDQDKVLFGSGTWGSVALPNDMTGATSGAAGVHGLVPAPAAGDQDKVLKGNATWADLPTTMIGATAGAAGAGGLVPAPTAGQQDYVLTGAGVWTAQSGGVAQAVIGNSYNASTAYTPGDRFTYNGKRYKVTITSGTVQGQTPPNANYYAECSVDDDISTLNNSLTGNNSWKILHSNATIAGTYLSVESVKNIASEYLLIAHYNNTIYFPTIVPAFLFNYVGDSYASLLVPGFGSSNYPHYIYANLSSGRGSSFNAYGIIINGTTVLQADMKMSVYYR